MMKKQRLHAILALSFAISFCFGITGCKDTQHTHLWANEYTCDSAEHWLTCAHCAEKKDVEKHTVSSLTCSVCGYDFIPTEELVYELSDDGSYASLVEYSGKDTRVVVAPTYEGVPVTKIKEYAFSGGNKLTSIILPDSIQTIGRFAFEGCSALTEMVIPNSVRFLGESIFIKCNNLTSLTLPFVGASIDSEENSNIGYFFGCDSESHQTGVPTSLKKVVITKATFIGEFAFRYCTNLSEVIIPRTVTLIRYGAFYACDALTSIFIPSSVAMIQNYAFAYCYDITIYCERESQPSNWDPRWNYDFPVVWGSKQ